MKLQQTIPKEKLERSKKYRLIEKEMLKVSYFSRDCILLLLNGLMNFLNFLAQKQVLRCKTESLKG